LESTVFPNVIEPSMGIDRIIFAMANNLLKKRSGSTSRIVFDLPLKVVPYEIALYALSNNNDLSKYVKTNLCFLNNHFSIFYDFSSTNIGKRYVRSDAIGVNLTITVDFQTLTDNAVTLRYSFDGHQERIHTDNIINHVKNILK